MLQAFSSGSRRVGASMRAIIAQGRRDTLNMPWSVNLASAQLGDVGNKLRLCRGGGGLGRRNNRGVTSFPWCCSKMPAERDAEGSALGRSSAATRRAIASQRTSVKLALTKESPRSFAGRLRFRGHKPTNAGRVNDFLSLQTQNRGRTRQEPGPLVTAPCRRAGYRHGRPIRPVASAFRGGGATCPGPDAALICSVRARCSTSVRPWHTPGTRRSRARWNRPAPGSIAPARRPSPRSAPR